MQQHPVAPRIPYPEEGKRPAPGTAALYPPEFRNKFYKKPQKPPPIQLEDAKALSKSCSYNQFYTDRLSKDTVHSFEARFYHFIHRVFIKNFLMHDGKHLGTKTIFKLLTLNHYRYDRKPHPTALRKDCLSGLGK